MRRRRTLRWLGSAAAATGLVLGLAAPALAESTSHGDPADATGSNTDIRAVQVDHRADRVRTSVGFTKLVRQSPSGAASLAIYLDTDASERGPEYRLGSGLEQGTDYALMRMRDWHVIGEPLTCDHHLRLEYPTDSAVTSVSRACLGNPDQVRAGIRMTDAADGSHPITDWFKGPQQWTRWLTAG